MPNIRTIRTGTMLFLMLLLGAVHAVARPISEEKACAVATRFYYMKTMGDAIKKVKALKALDLVYSPQHGGEVRYTQPEYFVFAPENGKGFVIVSGEDRAGRLIVGYSTEARISHRLSSSLQGYLPLTMVFSSDTAAAAHGVTFGAKPCHGQQIRTRSIIYTTRMRTAMAHPCCMFA